jgi:hypothetical protein
MGNKIQIPDKQEFYHITINRASGATERRSPKGRRPLPGPWVPSSWCLKKSKTKQKNILGHIDVETKKVYLVKQSKDRSSTQPKHGLGHIW